MKAMNKKLIIFWKPINLLR